MMVNQLEKLMVVIAEPMSIHTDLAIEGRRRGRPFDLAHTLAKLPIIIKPAGDDEPPGCHPGPERRLWRRRLANRPDPTFDLRGDGVVDNEELFFANMFDADRDGRLNDAELDTCRRALEGGLEKEWVQLPTGPRRITDIDRDNNAHRWICGDDDSRPASRTRSMMMGERSKVKRQAAATFLQQSSPKRRPLRARRRDPDDRAPIELSFLIKESDRAHSQWARSAEKIGERPPSSSAARLRSELLASRLDMSRATARESLSRLNVTRKHETIVLGTDTADQPPSGRRPCRPSIEDTPVSADPFKAEHVVDHEAVARRFALAGSVCREAPPQLSADEFSRCGRRQRIRPSATELIDDVNQRTRLSQIERADLLPLYSSFSRDNIYREHRYPEGRRRSRSASVPNPENLFERSRGTSLARPFTANIAADHQTNHEQRPHDMIDAIRRSGRVMATYRTIMAPIRSDGFQRSMIIN